MLSSALFGIFLAAVAMATPVTRATSGTRSAVDQSTYEKVVRNAGYPWLSQNLAGGGSCANPSNGATVLKYIESKITETQVAIWKNDNTKEIIVAIPGTNGVHDVVTDVSIILVPYIAPNIKCPSPCKVHVGFLAAWNSVASDVMNEVQSALASNPGYTTTVSGHSLGGGVAALAFASLKNGDFKVTQGYTYGQPRTGNKAFANYIDTVSGASDSDPGVLYRVTHADDNVPKLPPTALGYQHSRTEYWESSSDANSVETTYRCYGQEPGDCNKSAGQQSWILVLYDAIAHGFGNAAHTSYAGFDVSCG